MLKKFFLNTLSSFMGAWIALVLFGVVAFLVMMGIMAKIGAGNSNVQSVKKGSVMTIELFGEIVENELPLDINYMSLMRGDVERPQALSTLRSAIRAAAANANIEAIYLKCRGVAASPATLNALRDELISFKKSGKKIIAYGDQMGMGDYYVASVSDELCLNPMGEISLKGIGGSAMFYKGLLDKLGIQIQVIKVGTYKSAVEPYILTGMSEPARAQLDTLYRNIWKIIRQGISSYRKDLTPSKIDSLINSDYIFLKEGKADLAAGLVDKLYYERSMDSVIAAHIGKKKKELNFVSPDLLASQEDIQMGYNSKKRIAVLYATGEIVDGAPGSYINYERMVPVITELAEDDNVKGLVLRVNSPGGSVYGSEQIGEALDYFKTKGKPMAVSMGDYAASGGYWISCCADRIFADSLTITGSIGIFGLIPNASELMQKVGLNTELVSTNPDAAFPDLFKPLNERQLAGMQKMVEEGYDKFVARVARGRHLSEARVRQIGEGRVWDALKAKEIGLVDELAGLNAAIDWVADKAEVENYGVAYYPRPENSFLEYLMNSQFGINGKLRNLLGDKISDTMLKIVSDVWIQQGIQARMPAIEVKFM